MKPSIGWSAFALKRNRKGNHSKFIGPVNDLIPLIHKHWKKRVPGVGRPDMSQVVVVPIEEKSVGRLFQAPWSKVEDAHHLRAKVVQRQEGEDHYVEVHGKGKRLKAKFAKVVLYSATTLLENDGERSTDCDWEIVAIMAGPWDNEPMSPLTMARNFLQKPGGTFAPYTAHQFAESIYFWSQFVKVK
jgi:hypothetical protein